jgi:hypothetical protein
MPRKVKLIFNSTGDMGKAWRIANDLRPIIADYGLADWSGTVYPTHATELACQSGEQGHDRLETSTIAAHSFIFFITYA